MARIIQEFVAECCAADPINEERAKEWSPWRKDFVGFRGWLHLLESERKYPGQQFLDFDVCDPGYEGRFQTGYGEMTLEGDQLIFCTKNSRYVFRLLKDEEVQK